MSFSVCCYVFMGGFQLFYDFGTTAKVSFCFWWVCTKLILLYNCEAKIAKKLQKTLKNAWINGFFLSTSCLFLISANNLTIHKKNYAWQQDTI